MYRKRSSSRSRYGRKRSSSRSRSGYKSVKTQSKRIGYTRIAGNYGRFRGTGAKPELKWIDNVTDSLIALSQANPITDADFIWLVPGSGPTDISLCRIPPGSGASQCIGRKVHLRYIESKLRVHMNPFAPDPSNRDFAMTFRWVIAIDHQCNGSNPELKQLFASPNSSTTPSGGQDVSNTFSMRNLQYLKRFTILCDKKWTWTPKNVGWNRTQQTEDLPCNIAQPALNEGLFFEKSFSSVLNLPIEYDMSASLGPPAVAPPIDAIKSNNLFAVLMVDSRYAVGSATLFGAESLTRIRYSDV